MALKGPHTDLILDRAPIHAALTACKIGIAMRQLAATVERNIRNAIWMAPCHWEVKDYLFASQPAAAHARTSRNDRDPEIPRRPRICGRCRHGPSAWCHKQKACATSIFGQKCLRAEGASLRPCSQHRFDSYPHWMPCFITRQHLRTLSGSD